MCKVSIIIPNYNHAPFLKQRIDSVLEQTFQDFELIILDDGSADSSKEIIENYRGHPKVTQIIYNEINSGSTFKQWKKGIELAKAELVWIAESDDWSDINFLDTLIDKLNNETVSLAYCRTISVCGNEKKNVYQWGEAIHPEIWGRDYTFNGKEFIKLFLKYRNVIPNASAVIFRKKFFTDTEDILKMRYAGDWLLWIRLAEKGNIAYSHKTLNYFREHQDSTRSIKYFKEEKRRIEEYFMVINEISSMTGYRFQAFDKAYCWIIDEWLLRIKTFGMTKTLRPPYPLLFLLRFYYTILTSKF